MSAPLYDALLHFSDSDPLRLHMPGHKGRLDGPLSGASHIDFTELTPTGNLYTGEGPIREAEAQFARRAGAKDALFFSCGSTQGIFTMLASAVGMGGTLLLDRACHKSACHAMALLDITPRYLLPALTGTGLPAPITPALVEPALQAHPEIRALLVTSPGYYGVITPLAPLAELCRRYGIFLLVDQAHGAHFPWVDLPTAAQEGADLSVVSAHKTLPALGSSSILYLGERAPWTALELKSRSAIFGTTSPSYPILASIDRARDLLDASGAYAEAAAGTTALRQRINESTPFHALCPEDGFLLDPCRLTVDTLSGGLSGHEADRLLQQENIYVEMSDERFLVAILTCMDRPADLNCLLSALSRLSHGTPVPPDAAPPPLPRAACSIRSALFGPSESAPLRHAAGRISAQIIAPYPPGVPVIAPGEEITEKHIAYLQKKSYNIDEIIRVCRPSCP